MSYTLLGASTLGFDLVRLPQGEETAALLLTALSLTPSDLPGLAGVHPGKVRLQRWSHAMAQASGNRRAANITLSSTTGLHSSEAAKVLLRQLEISRLGTAESLDRLVRREILDWTWAEGSSVTDGAGVSAQSYLAKLASDVITDAVIGSYGVEYLDDSLATQLAAPFQEARLDLRDGHPLDLPTITSQIVLELGSMQPAARTRLLEAVEAGRPETASWAPAMHEATWAAYLSGRVRTAAAAQFLGVRAFRQAGFTPRDGAYGAWNAVSGMIAASVVADLLGAKHIHRLTRPWVAAMGELTGFTDA